MDPLEAFANIKNELQSNPECAANWHAHITAAAEAEGVDETTAKRLASRFMDAYFEVKV